MLKAINLDPKRKAELLLSAQQVVRYLIGGTTTAAISWSIIFILVDCFSIHYIISNNIATGCIYLYSYLVNKIFVFKDKHNDHKKQASGFVAMRIFLLIIANLIFFIGVDFFSIHYMLVAIFVSAFDAVISFLIMKFFIFKPAL